MKVSLRNLSTLIGLVVALVMLVGNTAYASESSYGDPWKNGASHKNVGVCDQQPTHRVTEEPEQDKTYFTLNLHWNGYKEVAYHYPDYFYDQYVRYTQKQGSTRTHTFDGAYNEVQTAASYVDAVWVCKATYRNKGNRLVSSKWTSIQFPRKGGSEVNVTEPRGRSTWKSSRTYEVLHAMRVDYVVVNFDDSAPDPGSEEYNGK